MTRTESRISLEAGILTKLGLTSFRVMANGELEPQHFVGAGETRNPRFPFPVPQVPARAPKQHAVVWARLGTLTTGIPQTAKGSERRAGSGIPICTPKT
jgi:hypothetical protein